MRKSKTLLIVIIVILVLLLGAGGTFAYLILGTDVFKSDKEMFFNYLSQIYAEENGFIDSNIYKLAEKKKNNPYKNEGELTVNANFPKELQESLGGGADKVNDLKIVFSGSVNNLAKKFEQDIELDYGNSVTFPIKIKFDGDMIGIQTKYVGSKYIAIENKNLKEIAQKFGADASIISEIPDEINIEDLMPKLTFSRDEINQIAENYGVVLKDQLSKEKFSKVKTIDGIEYTLTLTGEETKDLIIKLLENTKQNSIIKNKYNKYLEKISDLSNEDIDVQDLLDELIEYVQNMDTSNIQEVKISLNSANKNLNQINIQYGSDFKVNIMKNIENNIVSYNNCFNIIIPSDDNNSSKIDLTFNCTYNGLQGLETVEEKYDIGFDYTSNNNKTSYLYNVKNKIEFSVLNNSESMTETNSLILNDYEAEEIISFLNKVKERIILVNKQQMEKLGLEENDTPLLYVTPLSLLETVFLNSLNENMGNENDSTGQTEITLFNKQFSNYEGDNKSDKDVKELLQTVLTAKSSYSDRTILVYLDGTEIIEENSTEIPDNIELDNSKKYKIELTYNPESKYIDEILITTETDGDSEN